MSSDFLHLPGLPEILAALRMVDQWLTETAAEIEKAHPERTAEVEAILQKLKTAERLGVELAKLADAIAMFQTGKTPTSPDDADLA